jgi:hypothetical protein
MLKLLTRSDAIALPQHLLMAALIEPHVGRANPISREAIERRTAWTERYVKMTAEELRRVHRAALGAIRAGDSHGYYVIVDAADMEAAVQPYRNQILSMWATLAAFAPKSLLRELHGQLRVACDE